MLRVLREVDLSSKNLFNTLEIYVSEGSRDIFAASRYIHSYRHEQSRETESS